MLTFRWIARVSRQRQLLDELANRVTARCEPAVWTRVYPAAATMDPAQARGYIRARSALIVARETQIATAGLPQLGDSARQQLKIAVAQRVVHKTLGEVSLRRPPRLAELRAA